MTITDLPPSGLLDRRSEREVPDRLTAGVLSGQSGLVALRAEAFPERARSELRATGGETARRQPRQANDALISQEAQITSPEIGLQMLISPHPVEYHARKVFGELDVSLRRELGDEATPL
jgi:DNA-binding CsgD family transcriptional regulator